MFVDNVKIEVVAGKGGNGCVSFRREKFVPRGGPDGGDGGNGGDIYLKTDIQIHTLFDLRFRQLIRADAGKNGQGSNKHGKRGANVIVGVPVGTLVRDETTGELIADLDRDGAEELIAAGGRGGGGNSRFASSVNRTPRYAGSGKPGERRLLDLELKLLAEVGLVGMPNSGKSTLISKISSARPKIASYPFTTLTPNLGVALDDIDRRFTIADAPGLIEGAHLGAGLGLRFLKHLERTRILVHIVDLTEPDSLRKYKLIREELEKHDSDLGEKPEVVAGNKIDIAGIEENLAALLDYCSERDIPFFKISALTGEGTDDLVEYLFDALERPPIDEE